jgi:phytoene dehydrogenase-like protein
MQDFVWRETGLSDRLRIWAPEHPDLVYFPGQSVPTRIHDGAAALAREFADTWGERGDARAFFADEARVVRFLQSGYRAGRPPTLDAAVSELGVELAGLWITGSAADLLDHYFTAERTKVHVAMDVSESGPVSVHEPFSAFIMPMMASGSVFGGRYGYVLGGIWNVTGELGRINRELGVDLVTGCTVEEVDAPGGEIRYRTTDGDHRVQFDHLVFATDPRTAARLTGDASLIARTDALRVLGTSGKLNLMFRRPVQWKYDSAAPDSDTAFRYHFATETLADMEAATLAVTRGEDFVPGYFQIYCEGAAMRRMGLVEPFERLAVFFKHLALGRTGEQLAAVEAEVRGLILNHVLNPEDCVWSRMLTPRDLQQTFGFPGGNIEHTMLGDGQCYDQRNHSADPRRRFYQFGALGNVSICGASTYPCGSVAGTPAYMCVRELLRDLPRAAPS